MARRALNAKRVSVPESSVQPSKSLIRSARLAHEMRHVSGLGLSGGANVSQADFATVMERLRSIRANISIQDAATRFRDELGVDLFFGQGVFSGRNTISVGGDVLRFKKAVIATGTRPFVPPLPGLARSGFLTSDTVFSLTQRPMHLVAVGRSPNVEGMGLSTAGVDYTPRGIIVNERLQTTNPCIYAAGDCCMAHKFTHVADATARIVIGNALFGGRARASALNVPWCTYTDPEVAHIGLYERDAQRQGFQMETVSVPMSEADRAVTETHTDGFVRIHLKKGTDRILGATIVGSRSATQWIGRFMDQPVSVCCDKAGLIRCMPEFPYQAFSGDDL